MSKSRAPSFSKADSAACSRKMSATPFQANASPMAEAPRDLGDDPPVLPRLAGRRQERPLARDAALGVGDRAVLLAPRRAPAGGCGRHRRCRWRAIASETTESSQAAQRVAHRVGVGQAGDGIGRHDPHRLDLAGAHRLEQFDRLQARPASPCAVGVPEAADAVDVGRGEIHVRGERVGERADLAAAHGVGLAGDRERPHARPADAAGQQMAVDDGVDLVDAGARLVDALRIERDRLLGAREPVEEGCQVGRRQVALRRRRSARAAASAVVEADRVLVDEVVGAPRRGAAARPAAR